MAEAANLSVSITGDASGLISALESAESAILNVKSSASAVIGEFDGKEAQIKITAQDNTYDGVSSARANINSLTDKTVTVSVRYNILGASPLAAGTKNADEGLAVVNDEKGISDPRELIEHNGRLMMYGGRNVIVPLSKGDKVYTADETKSIMQGMGLPHYASGTKNEDFEIKKAEVKHYGKTHDVSPTEELAQWNELMEQFSYDGEAVKEIQEQIFSLQQKIWSETKKSANSALSDYKKQSDTWIKYQTEVCNMSASEQEEAYKRQLESYNAMVSDMVSSTLYSADEIKEIWDDFYEYKAGVDLKIGKLENEQKYAVYQKWQSDAENWANIRNTYDDWYEWGDSPVQFYERSIERIEEMYKNGYVGWQEYRDDTMYATLDLYKAKMEQVDTLLERQKSYISQLKQQFSDEESNLQESWSSEDRAESKAEISHQLSIYKNAVTQKGIDKYKSLQDEMKKLNREEELYNLQKAHSAKISELQESYDTVEANKKYLLAEIESSGINIEGIVGSVNYDIQSMQNTITSLFAQTISAIKSVKVSSNSYSDNRNISISTSGSSLVDALKNKVGLTIAHSRYY